MSNSILFSKAVLCIIFSFTFILNGTYASESPKDLLTTTNCELALELSLSNVETSPRQYDFYTITATLDNMGPETISDILIDFSRPDGVVYKGSDPFSLSHGYFTPHGAEEWTIEDLAPGERATLTVNYFLLAEEAPIANIDIVSCSGDSGFRFPDLVISNLSVQNEVVRPAGMLSYTFDIANIGEVDAPNNFSIISWLSRDNVLSSDDIAIDVMPAGNFDAGFEVSRITRISNIAPDIEEGEYVLIVEIDGDDQVLEDNEDNNTVLFPIAIIDDTVDEPVSMPGECVSDLIIGDFVCNNTGPDGELVIITADNGFLIENKVSGLQQIDSEIIGIESLGVRYRIVQDVFTKFVDGSIEFEMPVPEELSNEFTLARTAIEFEDGFMILGFPFADDGTRSFDEVYAIFTDRDLIPIQTNFITEGIGDGIPPGISSFISIPNDRFLFTLVRGRSPHFELSRIIFDSDLNLIEEVLVADQSANIVTGGFGQQACGNYRQTTSVSIFGAYSRIEDTFFTLVNDVFIPQSKITRTTKEARPGPSTLTERYSYKMSDGGTLDASHHQPNTSGPIGMNVKIERRTADFDLVYEYIVKIENPYLIRNIIEFDGRPMLIIEQPGGEQIVDLECLRDSEVELSNVDVSLDVVVDVNEANVYSFYDITYLLFNEGEQMVTDIVVDIPRPEEVVYRGGSEFDTNSGDFSPYGDQKWRVDELAPGEEIFLTLSYFTLEEGEFLNYAEIAQMNQEDVDSTPGNGTCCNTNEDDEVFFFQTVGRNNSSNAIVQDDIATYPVELKSVSPNPTFAETIHARIYSKEAETRTLNCYNAVGGLEYTFEVNLESGWNEVPLEISKLVAGTYILYLTELNWKQTPVRFVVVRD